jgi:predicted ABC-type ATPase
MSTPVLHLLAGPNGSGKTTFYEQVVAPATHLPFVNADRIAAERWPGEELEHGYEASLEAAALRDRLLAERRSFVSETVFSHPSKVELLRDAAAAGYLSTLHVIVVPVELAVARVALRVEYGGHDVPEEKIRSRYERLWAHIAEAVTVADSTRFYENTNAERPYRLLARFEHGRPSSPIDWPAWVPAPLRAFPG